MKAFLLAVFAVSALASEKTIHLYPGFVTKVRCEGKLLVSVVGSEALVRLDALPKELGCGVLLKPMTSGARTNLILETSTGTVRRLIEIQSTPKTPTSEELEYRLKGEEG